MKTYTSNIFFIICLTVFSFLTDTMCFAQNADIQLLRNFNKRTKGTEGIMIATTNSVYPFAAAAPITEIIVGYVKHDNITFEKGIQTIAGLGLNFLATEGFKYTLNKDRPYITYTNLNPYQWNTDPTFPSGHTSFAFNTATSLSMCYPKWYVIIPSYLWACSVGYSRMYLGMHYPSDVAAGAIIGTATAWFAKKGNDYLKYRRRKKFMIDHD